MIHCLKTYTIKFIRKPNIMGKENTRQFKQIPKQTFHSCITCNSSDPCMRDLPIKSSMPFGILVPTGLSSTQTFAPLASPQFSTQHLRQLMLTFLIHQFLSRTVRHHYQLLMGRIKFQHRIQHHQLALALKLTHSHSQLLLINKVFNQHSMAFWDSVANIHLAPFPLDHSSSTTSNAIPK